MIRSFAPNTGPSGRPQPSYPGPVEPKQQIETSLRASVSIAVTELTAEGMASANDAKLYPYAQISEFLDGRVCPLCAAVDGMILDVTSPEFRKWRQPSHIGCRRTMAYISAAEQSTEVSFREPDADLIRKHGHYHLDPDKYAELRVPSEPGGRQFIARRVKSLETEEVKTVLDWAPWWEQIPAWKRTVVQKARAAAKDGPLKDALTLLGITDPQDAGQFRLIALYGLRDRLAGWVTEAVRRGLDGPWGSA